MSDRVGRVKERLRPAGLELVVGALEDGVPTRHARMGGRVRTSTLWRVPTTKRRAASGSRQASGVQEVERFEGGTPRRIAAAGANRAASRRRTRTEAAGSSVDLKPAGLADQRRHLDGKRCLSDAARKREEADESGIADEIRQDRGVGRR